MTKPNVTRPPTLAWPEEGLARIPYEVYHDAELYALEQQRVFQGKTWNFVGLAAEIPNPGDFFRHYVGDTPVVVSRDKGGEVNVLVNRCSHRGMQFCQQQHGN